MKGCVFEMLFGMVIKFVCIGGNEFPCLGRDYTLSAADNPGASVCEYTFKPKRLLSGYAPALLYLKAPQFFSESKIASRVLIM